MIDNYPGRRDIGGDVDFTMMYAAHDAFSRHLTWIADGLEAGGRQSALAVKRWRLLARQLHIHHTAEDTSLWPVLRSTVSSPEELAVLDAMEAEHAMLDPALAQVEAEVTSGLLGDAAVTVRELATGLGRHMRHEENEALPLIDAYLGRAGWAAFGKSIRTTQGVKGASVYLPWVLDGAPADVATKVLAVLPAPARLVYKLVWRRRYRAEYTEISQ